MKKILLILIVITCTQPSYALYENCYTAIDSFRYYRNHPELWEDSYLKREALGLPHPEPKQNQALIFTAGTTWVEGHLTTSAIWDTGYSPYIITGDFYIDYPCTLWIRPGVDVLFHRPGGLYSIIVDGYLMAIGNLTDSITFSYDTLINPDDVQWESIIFDNSEDTISTLIYCKIKYGLDCVYCRNGSPLINECSIILNYRSTDLCCGICCRNFCQPKIFNNYFTTGYHYSDVGLSIEDNVNCIVRSNYFYKISGSIILGDNSSAIIDSNHFRNVASGVNIFNSSPDCDILIRRNVFEKVSSKAIDVHGSNSIVEIFNNTFFNNEEFGVVVCYGGKAEIVNNILYQNGVDSSGYHGAIGICPDGSNVWIKHNLFNNNFNDFGGGEYYIPPGVKEITTVNFNGDSCDTFYNLFNYDPLIDTTTFYLTEESPCIDAGDPALLWDPDSTRPDIGAFYYDTSVGVNEPVPAIPNNINLHCYPTPFNSSLAIQAPTGCRVLIFDIRGKLIIDENSNIFRWTPDESVSSGIYLIRAIDDSRSLTKKVIFLK